MSEAGAVRISERNFKLTASGVYRALVDLGKAVDEGGLDKQLIELVKIRASQVNGCAYCVQYHVNLARRLGIAAARVDLLPVWRETVIYNARERAALAWTEALCAMDGREVPDAQYDEVAAVFDARELAYLTSAIATINAWNRIAGALRFAPPIPAANLEGTAPQTAANPARPIPAAAHVDA